MRQGWASAAREIASAGEDVLLDEPTAADFDIESLPGCAPTMGHLVSMLGYSRMTMLREVEGLAEAELSHRGQVRLIKRRLPA